jgi:phosphoglycolate phosphatase
MKNVEAIVLDLDGTLVDSIQDTTAALNSVLTGAGCPNLHANQVMDLIGNGAPYMISEAFGRVGCQLSPEALESELRSYMDFYISNPTTDTKLYDGVRETLEALRERGLELGVCSNKSVSIVTEILSGLEIDHFFCGVTGGDSFPHAKPDGRHILSTLDLMGVSVCRALMVGDSEKDVAAALSARVPIAVVTYGYAKDAAIFKEADFVIESFSSLIELVDSIPIAPARS